MSSELSQKEILERYHIKKNKNLLKLAMIQKIFDKHGIPNTCPVKEVVTTTVNPSEGSVTIKRVRPLQEGGNTHKTTHVHVQESGNKVDFVVAD